MKQYNPAEIEKKWQKNWAEAQTFVARDDSKKPKELVLIEFPYPSGEGLHMGHLRPYVAGDVFARYQRLKGKETMFPMGWDAFGLPAENYALKQGVHPRVTTEQNIANAKRQVQSWGISFDWSREVNTTDPNYYKWTQWIFLQFYKAGLAYEATGLINWCPFDKTGLANEEVINGKCERCGNEVEKKEMRQWYLKITAYADKLLDGLKSLSEWPEAVKAQQANWIGRSGGAEVDFEIRGTPEGEQDKITVFTTRPDTIFGTTYLVLAPEHPLLEKLESSIENIDEVLTYVQAATSKVEQDRIAEGKDKTGVQIQGLTAINPATKQEIPIWVADYVLGNYGTGAIMAVPAHDDRDFAFATKFNLPIVQVVAPHVIDPENPPKDGKENTKRQIIHALVKHPEKDEIITLKWKTQPWHTFIIGGIEEGEDAVAAAKREVMEETGYKNLKFVKQLPYQIFAEFYAAHKDVNRAVFANFVFFELENLEKDEVSAEEAALADVVWLPIKDIDGLKPVSELSHVIDWLQNGDHPYIGEGILMNSNGYDGQNSEEALPRIAQQFGRPTTQYHLRDWVFSRQRYWGEPIPIVHCPKCGTVPVPEKDLPVVLPEVEQYEPTGTGESPLAVIDEWVNVRCPKCGGDAKRETNTMPQWAGSSWYYLRYTDPHNDRVFASSEKMKHWLPVDIYFGGMEHTTLHLLYSRFWNLFLHDQGLVPVAEPYQKRIPHGIILASDGEKMSKSRGNVVNPDEVVAKFGADVLRMYELFLGPHEMTVSWNDKGIVGVQRFLDRVWLSLQGSQFGSGIQEVESHDEAFERILHRAIKNITEDIEDYRFNTAISELMIALNEAKEHLQRHPVTPAVIEQFKQTYLILLYPFAPHIAEELHEILGGTSSLQLASWPIFDPEKITSDVLNVIVQINGKTRDKLEIPITSSEDEIKAAVLKLEKVQAALAGKEPQRLVVVPGKLVNVVV
jgi:leucyl-tRNA synthetase